MHGLHLTWGFSSENLEYKLRTFSDPHLGNNLYPEMKNSVMGLVPRTHINMWVYSDLFLRISYVLCSPRSLWEHPTQPRVTWNQSSSCLSFSNVEIHTNTALPCFCDAGTQRSLSRAPHNHTHQPATSPAVLWFWSCVLSLPKDVRAGGIKIGLE